MNKDIRVFEKIEFHISNEEKAVSRNCTPEELIDTLAKFAGRNLLIAYWLSNKMSEYNKLKKDLESSNKELEETQSSLQASQKVREG